MIDLADINCSTRRTESPGFRFASSPISNRLTSENGARAELSDSSQGQTIKIFSNRKELVVEYDPETGKTRFNIPTGDLEIVTQNGNIDFNASEKIRFNADAIEMTGKNGICFGIIGSLGRMVSSIRLQSHRAQMTSQQLGITSQRVDMHADEARLTGKKCDLKIGRVRVIADRFESVTNTVIQKSKNVYRTVTGLFQLKAGRKRTIVESTYHLKAEKTNLKAKDSFKIDGKKIFVG